MISISVLVFVYGAVEFIAGADNDQKRSDGKRHLIWGVIGIFIMVSVFGILNVLVRTIANIGS